MNSESGDLKFLSTFLGRLGRLDRGAFAVYGVLVFVHGFRVQVSARVRLVRLGVLRSEGTYRAQVPLPGDDHPKDQGNKDDGAAGDWGVV